MNIKEVCGKLAELIFTVFFVTVLSFLLMRLSPIDPATAYAKRSIGNPSPQQIEHIRVQLGFDKPLAVQYAVWIKKVCHFDLGISLTNGKKVWDSIAAALPKTIAIVFISACMHIIGITLLSGAVFLSHNTQIYRALQGLCLVGISIPSFYIAIVYIDFFAVKAGLMSVTGHTDTASYFSPALCIALFGIAFYCPLFYKQLQKESSEDYAFFYRANGVPEYRLFLFHFLPNASRASIPHFFQNLGLMIANSTIVERIFSIPGFGYLIVNAVLDRDAPMIHGVIFFLAFIIACTNIIADTLNESMRRI